MSHVVYEEEYLGNFPRAETFTEEEVQLPLPDRAAEHQGLYLATDDDHLVGRAENGEWHVSAFPPVASSFSAKPILDSTSAPSVLVHAHIELFFLFCAFSTGSCRKQKVQDSHAFTKMVLKCMHVHACLAQQVHLLLA